MPISLIRALRQGCPCLGSTVERAIKVPKQQMLHCPVHYQLLHGNEILRMRRKVGYPQHIPTIKFVTRLRNLVSSGGRMPTASREL